MTCWPPTHRPSIRAIPTSGQLGTFREPNRSYEHGSIAPKPPRSVAHVCILEGLLIQPNRVFVIPEQRDLHVLDGEFLLKPISKPRGWPDVITVFLRSLTQHWGGKLIAVIVSGYDGDGAAALCGIKEVGGVTIAQKLDTAGQPLRCIWSVHRALILAVSYILKQSICSFSGPALLRPASKQWPPCGALPRAWPSLRIPSYAVIVSCLPVQANPRITTAPRRPTDGRAGHRAIGEKCCTQIRKAYRTRNLLWPQPPFERP